MSQNTKQPERKACKPNKHQFITKKGIVSCKKCGVFVDENGVNFIK